MSPLYSLLSGLLSSSLALEEGLGGRTGALALGGKRAGAHSLGGRTGALARPRRLGGGSDEPMTQSLVVVGFNQSRWWAQNYYILVSS